MVINNIREDCRPLGTSHNFFRAPTCPIFPIFSYKKQEFLYSEGRSAKVPIIIQYRGKCTEDYARALHKCKAPCTIVMTLRKLKTVLPSLKPSVDKMFKSGVVYKIMCSRCKACYVGQTSRHLQSRFNEHKRGGPVKIHLNECNVNINEENVDILQTTSRGENHLLTLEALNIREIKPSINTKDEYRSRELTIKL